MVYPRDPNPYQELLYKELELLQVNHRYIGELSSSHTLNLLLLPFELAVNRLRGFRCLHLHWMYRFGIPLRGRHQILRRMMRWYVVGLLEWCRMIGVAVVWTAHNVVPHGQVFDDDELGRRQLTARCAAVIAHSEETLRVLAAMGCTLPVTAVIAHGPLNLPFYAGAARHPEPRTTQRIVFAGRVSDYKGVEDLLEVLATYDVPPHLSCVIAGACDDPALAERLGQAAARSRIPVELRLHYLSVEELTDLLNSADAVVLPFRRTTSSGSVLLALGAGCPVIIPDLAALDDVPRACAWRYDGTLAGLAGALRDAASTSAPRRLEMSAAALAHVRTRSWPDVAKATKEVLQNAIGVTPTPAPMQGEVASR